MKTPLFSKLIKGLLCAMVIGQVSGLVQAPQTVAKDISATAFAIELESSEVELASTTGDSNPDTDSIRDDLPIIPAPELLPAPKQTGNAADVQNYLLGTTIPKAINMGTGLLALSTFISFVIAAVHMLTALGDESQYERAKNNVKYSITGFLFVIFAYTIVSIVVSFTLPTEDDNQAWNSPWDSMSMTAWIPTAHALDIEDTQNLLLPSANDFIGNQTNVRNVNLPSGDFLGEILPSLFVNILYLVSFAVFISLVYGGALIVLNRGNEEEVNKAKTILLNASYAIALLSLGYGIVQGLATLSLDQDASTTKDDTFTELQNE